MSEPKTMQSNAKQCFDIAEPQPMLRRRSRRNSRKVPSLLQHCRGAADVAQSETSSKVLSLLQHCRTAADVADAKRLRLVLNFSSRSRQGGPAGAGKVGGSLSEGLSLRDCTPGLWPHTSYVAGRRSAAFKPPRCYALRATL